MISFFIHIETNRFDCEVCGRNCNNAISLMAHQQRHNKKERKFKCKFEGCEKSFISSSALK